MNRTVKLTLFVLFLSLLSFTAFAQEPQKITETSKIAEGVILEHTYEKGSVGSFDKLFVNVNGEKKEIFNSEGRKIKEVIPVKNNNPDGKLDYVVSMDCGGSGGYYDIALLQPKGESWTTSWEDSFAQPKMKFEKKENKTILVIEHFEIENDKPVKKVTTFDFSTNMVLNGK